MITKKELERLVKQFITEVDLIDSYSGTPSGTWENLARKYYKRFKEIDFEPRKRDLKLKDWNEVQDFMKKHLKPVSKDPRGGPIYSGTEMAKLRLKHRMVFPDEKGPFKP